jgi:hypothetical protein
MADTLNFTARAYNQFERGRNNLTLIKKSKNSKLKEEAEYYAQLPIPLRLYFPRYVWRWSSGSEYFLELENLPGPNAGELLVNQSRPKEFWDDLFKFCAQYIEDYKSFASIPARPDDMKAMLIDKTEKEYAALIKSGGFDFLQKDLIVNGVPIQPFEKVWPRIKSDLLNLIETQEKEFYIIHGDFHLSNIIVLENGDNRTFKFVDPRGSFGDTQSWGSSLYDVAKLAHSFIYSTLITDNFHLERRSDSISYYPNSVDQNAPQSFQDVFLTESNKDSVLAVMATQFIGMAARHTPHTDRQTGMILAGLAVMNNLANE